MQLTLTRQVNFDRQSCHSPHFQVQVNLTIGNTFQLGVRDLCWQDQKLALAAYK